MQYYLNVGGSVVGPMHAHQVIAYNVNPDTSVSVDGCNWAPLYTFPELMQVYHSSKNGQSASSLTDSKRILCGIMALLFGTLGVQYFIIGKIPAGFITILLSIVTCGAWSLIVLVQGVLILCMSDAEFEQKYVNTTKTFPLF